MFSGCFVLLLVFHCSSVLPREHDPEESMAVPDMINKRWGYPVEVYEVHTPDGYILEVHRVPHGKNDTVNGSKPVVFMQHGLLCTSANWVTNLPNESAAFIFADNGFDVWLGNFRGNTYGKQHETLSSKNDDFWAFSWDHSAKYDLPTMIDFALNVTGQPHLYYIGHSEGTMAGFAKFSDDVEFSKKVKKFFALAPIVTLGHIKGLLTYLGPVAPEIDIFFHLFGSGEFLPSAWWMKLAAKYVCGWSYTDVVCNDILFLITGPNSHQLNNSRLGVYMSHTPAGTSTRNILHFAQGISSNKFQTFDFTLPQLNMEHYGQRTPRQYHIENMETELYAFYGAEDYLGNPTDVEANMKKIQNLKLLQKCEGFNHLDFIWGQKAAPEVYLKILDIVKKDLGLE